MSTHYAGWLELAEETCERFGYDKVTAIVSSPEAADTACKIARKWGITHRKIPAEEAIVLGTSYKYHDLTSGIWPIMNPGNQAGYVAFDKNLITFTPRRVNYFARDITFQEEIDFAIGVRQLYKRNSILFISDEIRMGSGKTGKFLYSDWLGPKNKPDMVTLGNRFIQTGGTFTMAPAAVAATVAALKIYDEEKLTEKTLIVEDKWKKTTSKRDYPWVKYVTSRGADMST
ncbi:hypothetical protein K4K49_003254 [Colletotrichum sp. SAR 10_70]|nr:hypothetical protein K4K50_002506 [Colletotrichum sp. SAR 10_71]KAI8173030.1 hypothetical protein K4K49_003254 [Colletotrichum sp. SAR 10_70]